MPGTAVVVFTQETVEQLMQAGGSSCWAVDPNRAAGRDYVVCTHNSQDADHRAAFLVGRLTHLGDCDRPGRRRPTGYTLFFDRYALVHVEEAWPRGRQQPVSYVDDVEELLGLELAALQWHEMQ